MKMPFLVLVAAILPGTVAVAGTDANAPGPFQPTWESLASQYHTPEWSRDAKFGIWAHWVRSASPSPGTDMRGTCMFPAKKPCYIAFALKINLRATS